MDEEMRRQDTLPRERQQVPWTLEEVGGGHTDRSISSPAQPLTPGPTLSLSIQWVT